MLLRSLLFYSAPLRYEAIVNRKVYYKHVEDCFVPRNDAVAKKALTVQQGPFIIK
jgi:hypothetical protein